MLLKTEVALRRKYHYVYRIGPPDRTRTKGSLTIQNGLISLLCLRSAMAEMKTVWNSAIAAAGR
jgi:hypothetical protein